MAGGRLPEAVDAVGSSSSSASETSGLEAAGELEAAFFDLSGREDVEITGDRGVMDRGEEIFVRMDENSEAYAIVEDIVSGIDENMECIEELNCDILDEM